MKPRTLLQSLLMMTLAVPGMALAASIVPKDLTVPGDFSIDNDATSPKLMIRTSPANLPIYEYGADAPGKSNCNAGCIGAWSPVVATSTSTMGPWTIITRDDGRKQWAYKGHPLYTFFTDEPGKPTGDGQEDGKWHLFQP